MASSVKYNLIIKLFEKSDEDIRLADKRALALQINGDKTISDLTAAIINKYKALTGFVLTVQELRDGDNATFTDDDLVEDCFTLKKDAGGNTNLYTVRVVRSALDPEEQARREREGTLTRGGSGDFRHIGEREAAEYQAEQEHARRESLKRRRGGSAGSPSLNASIERNSLEPETFYEATEASHKRQRLGEHGRESPLDLRQQSVQLTHAQTRPDPEPLVPKSESPEPQREQDGPIKPFTPLGSPPSHVHEGLLARQALRPPPDDPDEVSPAKENRQQDLRQYGFPSMVSNPIAFMGTSKSPQMDIFEPGSQEPLKDPLAVRRQVKPLGKPSRLAKKAVSQTETAARLEPPKETTSNSPTSTSSNSGSKQQTVAATPSGRKRRHDPSDQLTPVKLRILDDERAIDRQGLGQPSVHEDTVDIDLLQDSQPMEACAAANATPKLGPSHLENNTITHSSTVRASKGSPKRSILKQPSGLSNTNGEPSKSPNGDTGAQQPFRRSVSFANDDHSTSDDREQQVSGIATSYAKKTRRGPPPDLIETEAQQIGSTDSDSDDSEDDSSQSDSFIDDRELGDEADNTSSDGKESERNLDSSRESESPRETNDSRAAINERSSTKDTRSAREKSTPVKETPAKAKRAANGTAPSVNSTNQRTKKAPSKITEERSSFLAELSKLSQQKRPQFEVLQAQNGSTPNTPKRTGAKKTQLSVVKAPPGNTEASPAETLSVPSGMSTVAKVSSPGPAKRSSPSKRSSKAKIRSAKTTDSYSGTRSSRSLPTNVAAGNEANSTTAKPESSVAQMNHDITTGAQEQPESKVPEVIESSSDDDSSSSSSDDASEIPAQPPRRSQSNEPARHITEDEENKSVSSSDSDPDSDYESEEKSTETNQDQKSSKLTGRVSNERTKDGVHPRKSSNRSDTKAVDPKSKEILNNQIPSSSKARSTNMDLPLSTLMNPLPAKEPISMLSGESSSDGDDPQLPILPSPNQGRERIELTLASDSESSNGSNVQTSKPHGVKPNAKPSSQATTIFEPSTQNESATKTHVNNTRSRPGESQDVPKQSSQFETMSTPTPAGLGRGKGNTRGQSVRGRGTRTSAAAKSAGRGRGTEIPSSNIRKTNMTGLQAMMNERNQRGTAADKHPLKNAKASVQVGKGSNSANKNTSDNSESDDEDDSDDDDDDSDSDRERSSKKKKKSAVKHKRDFDSLVKGCKESVKKALFFAG